MSSQVFNILWGGKTRSAMPLRDIAFVFALGCILVLPAPAATFTASLDRETITVGEQTTLTLKVEGGEPQAMPGPPGIPGLEFAGQGTSRNINIINGQTSSSVSEVYVITGQKPGEYVIPALISVVDGQRLQSQELRLKVVKSDPTTPSAENGDKLALIGLALPKTNIVLGETMVAQLQLYVRGDVRQITDLQPPSLAGDGFSVGNLVEGQRFQRRVGNNQFLVLTWSVALTPVKTGNLTVGPSSGSVVVHVLGGRRSRDLFENFFGPQTQPQRVPLALDAYAINVTPLPSQNVPPNFSGAVGNYNMAFSAGPTNVAVGDPITIKVQISGQGHLDGITLPNMGAWRDFNTYPPTTRVETTDKLGIQGSKFFEQIVVPQNTEVKELPPFSFSFFDTDRMAYRTITQPATALVVRHGGSAPAPTVVTAGRTSQANGPPPLDIVPIKQRTGPVAQIGPPLVQQPWFLALQTVPLLAWVSSVVWRKRSESLANNPRLRRQRQVAKLINEGLADLGRLAAEKKSDEFFGVMFHLLQEQLGERLDMPASAITEAVVEERLRPARAPESIVKGLEELFQMCNLARYAPIKSSQELAALIPKVESVLRE